MDDVDVTLDRLKRSAFRSRFKLVPRDRAYAASRAMIVLENHARDFVASRLAPAHPRNDGKQTPFKGHPVFTAQHATATCCRTCLAKWHGIAQGRELDDRQREYVVAVIVRWIARQLEQQK